MKGGTMATKKDDSIIYINDPDQIKKIYLNTGILSQVFGLGARSIQSLSNDSIIKAETIPGQKRQAYQLLKSVSNYCEHLRAKATGRSSTDKESELKQKKLEAEIALKESQGELHRLKTEIAAGRYISVEDVKADYEKFFIILKKFAMALPNRVGVQINGYVDPLTVRSIEKDLTVEVQSMLNAFINAAIISDSTPTTEKEKDNTE